MPEFKRIYTKEEVADIVGWARALTYEGRIDMGHGQVATNAKVTATAIANQIENQTDNPCFAGMVHKLMVLREAINHMS